MSEDDRWKINIFQSVDFSLTNGFQLTTAAGGLCEEPLEGVAIYIDSLEITRVPDSGWFLNFPYFFFLFTIFFTDLNKYGPFKGQLMSTICQGLKQAIEDGRPHIVEPYYQATIQIPSNFSCTFQTLISNPKHQQNGSAMQHLSYSKEDQKSQTKTSSKERISVLSMPRSL